jgi:fatty-acyl-CoA synthase
MSQMTQDVSYGDLIIEALRRYPRREAFVFGPRRISYAETASRTSRFVQALASRGVSDRSSVAVLSPNMPEVWMLQVAACLLGARYSGLHPLGSVADLLHICDHAGVEVLVVHPDYLDRGGEVASRSASVRHLLALGPASGAEDLLALSEAYCDNKLVRRRTDPEEVRWVAYTGGTTGRPKGVEIPDRALVQQVQTLTTSLGFPEVPRFLAVAPISHAGVLPIVPTLVRGGTVVLQRTFDPVTWPATVAREHINWTFLVPTMLYALLDQARPQEADLSSLETIMYGAAPISPSRLMEAHEVIGPVFLQAYGQTECVSFATMLRKDEHDPEHNPSLLNSCGRAVLGMRVAVLGEDGEPVPPGAVGEICVRGPGIMKGYHRMPRESAEALSGDWLHTGDLATCDEGGFIYIVDRKKDMIVTGGFNVYSREIEDVIAEVPGVSAVAVIGVPDDKWGEAVKAVVVPRPGEAIDSLAVIEAVKAKKGPHQAPKSVDIVERLPVTSIGKIDKKALRESYWGARQRRVN